MSFEPYYTPVRGKYSPAERDAMFDMIVAGHGITPNYGKGVNLLRDWYFVGGGSQKGYGYFPINQREGYVVPPGTEYFSDIALTQYVDNTTSYIKAIRINDTYSIVYFHEDAQYTCRTSDIVPGYVGAGYGIDGWKSVGSGSSVALSDASLTANGGSSGLWLNQFFDNGQSYYGKTYTLSLLYSGGTLKTATGELASDGTGGVTVSDAIGGWATFRVENSQLRAQINVGANQTANIVAVKLELGETQTLAHMENGVWVLNEIPDYGEELAKCQVYGFPIVNGAWKTVGMGVVLAGNRAFVHCSCTVAPRINGSAIINDLWIIQGKTAYQIEKVSTVAFSVSAGEILADVYTVGNGMTVGDVVSLGTGANSGTLFLDAEIY